MRTSRVRPTPLVILPIGTATALLSLAVLVGNVWLMVVGLAALGLVAVAAPTRAGDGLEVQVTGPDRVSAGAPVTHQLLVRNRGPRPTGPFELTHELRGLTPTRVYVGLLAPGETVRTEIARLAGGRGVTGSGRLVLRASGPLGVLATSRERECGPGLVVHPAHSQAARVAERSTGLDEAVDPRPGPGLDLASVREWHPGDDPRRVHWRSTARRGQLVVAERGIGAEPGLVVDVVGPSAAPDWEQVVARAAATTRLAQQSGREVVVRAWAGAEPSVIATRSVVDLLDWWAALGAVALPAPARVVAALHGAGTVQTPPTSVVALSAHETDWWADVRRRALAAGRPIARLDLS